MELVEGETLETRLRKSGPLPPSLALEVITQAARALVALETHGLVHRDLKPANLMLVERPELTVKMIDFGLAKAAATAKGESDITHGGFVGTPSFASPEQFTNTRACRRPPLPLREPNWEAAADNPGTGQDFISQTTRYRKRCFWSGGELRRKTQFFHGKYYIYATLIAGPETERRVTMQTTKSVGSVNKKSSGHGWTCPPWQRLVAAQT
jgi:serine/threonine protein kinase